MECMYGMHLKVVSSLKSSHLWNVYGYMSVINLECLRRREENMVCPHMFGLSFI